MKSVPKLIRRFVGIMLLSIVLLILLNVLFYALLFVKTPTISAWDVADMTAAALQLTENGYSLSDDMAAKLKEQNVWAILIDDNTRQFLWQTDDLPDNIPTQYTLSDIANLTWGYLDGYPTFTGEAENGLLVLGYPKDSYWKHMRASWDYDFIANLPKNTFIIFSVNMVPIFFIYAIANSRMLGSCCHYKAKQTNKGLD